MDNSSNKLDLLYERFDRRFKLKKTVNLVISAIIVIIGILPMYLVFAKKAGIFALRWLTVNGTLFTMIGSLIFVFINIFEILTRKEMTYVPVYFLRLSCAVSESVIMIVVLIGLFLGDVSALDEWDEIITHVVMPVLTVVSFITNDSPIGRVKKYRLLHGTWFITTYGIIIAIFFSTGLLPMNMIPYFFLDPKVLPPVKIFGSVVIVYLIAFFISMILYRLNSRLSWLWFKPGKK